MLELGVDAFIAVWHCGKLFGFLSTFASGYIIQSVAPKDHLGYWVGQNDMYTNLAQVSTAPRCAARCCCCSSFWTLNLAEAVTPLIFASVYDGFGNVRGQEMLAFTATISLFAVGAYVPIISMMPPPPKG
jgi:hypothetical protein